MNRLWCRVENIYFNESIGFGLIISPCLTPSVDLYRILKIVKIWWMYKASLGVKLLAIFLDEIPGQSNLLNILFWVLQDDVFDPILEIQN